MNKDEYRSYLSKPENTKAKLVEIAISIASDNARMLGSRKRDEIIDWLVENSFLNTIGKFQANYGKGYTPLVKKERKPRGPNKKPKIPKPYKAPKEPKAPKIKIIKEKEPRAGKGLRRVQPVMGAVKPKKVRAPKEPKPPKIPKPYKAPKITKKMFLGTPILNIDAKAPKVPKLTKAGVPRKPRGPNKKKKVVVEDY
jgi:hypothetical protein